MRTILSYSVHKCNSVIIIVCKQVNIAIELWPSRSFAICTNLLEYYLQDSYLMATLLINEVIHRIFNT